MVTSTKEVICFHVHLFVYVNRIFEKLGPTDQIFMKFYGIIGHNPRTNLIDFK